MWCKWCYCIFHNTAKHIKMRLKPKMRENWIFWSNPGILAGSKITEETNTNKRKQLWFWAFNFWLPNSSWEERGPHLPLASMNTEYPRTWRNATEELRDHFNFVLLKRCGFKQRLLVFTPKKGLRWMCLQTTLEILKKTTATTEEKTQV